MSKPFVILFLLLFFIYLGTKAQSRLFKGKIGNRELLLQLTFEADVREVSYFFPDEKRMRILDSIRIKDDSIIFTVQDYDSDGDFFLVKYEAGYRGIFVKENNRSAIVLSPASTEDYPNSFSDFDTIKNLKQEDQLAYVFIFFLKRSSDSLVMHNGFRLHYFKDPDIEIPFVQLDNKDKKPAIEKINRQLTGKWLVECLAYFGCSRPGRTTEYYFSINHVFITRNILSVDMCNSYDCGGVHPDAECRAMNFDMVTGKELQLEDVIWFGKGIVPKEDSMEWFNYRGDVFAPKIVEIFTKLYPKEISDTSDSYCTYTEPVHWEFPHWYFTKLGLYIGASFPHAAAPCGDPEWSILPYRIVRKHRNKNVKLNLSM